MAGLIVLGIAALVAVYGVVVYNGLVNLKHGAAKAWANIDVLLKQRHDELPKLVETCRQYMQFEQATLEKVMTARASLQAARSSGDVKAVGLAEGPLRAGVGAIVATAEAYPELRANVSFQQLLARITGLENALSDRRELYNETVNMLNVRIEQFPDVLVARLGRFPPLPLLEFDAADLADVDVRTLFRS